ncbi:uncharacterized protein LOC144438650 [Glandiceps talaboti]
MTVFERRTHRMTLSVLFILLVGVINCQESGPIPTEQIDQNVTTSLPELVSCPDEKGFKFYYDSARKQCRKCPRCNRGYQQNQECGNGIGEGTECELCPFGSYSDRYGYTKCRQCIVHCSNVLYLALKCTRLHDRKCGPCKPGYFKSIFNNCEPCHYYDHKDAPGCPLPTDPPPSTQVDHSPSLSSSSSPSSSSRRPPPPPQQNSDTVKSTYTKGKNNVGVIITNTRGTVTILPTTRSNRESSVVPARKNEPAEVDIDIKELEAKEESGYHLKSSIVTLLLSAVGLSILLTATASLVACVCYHKKCQHYYRNAPVADPDVSDPGPGNEKGQVRLCTQTQTVFFDNSKNTGFKTECVPNDHELRTIAEGLKTDEPMVTTTVIHEKKTEARGSPSKKRKFTSDLGRRRCRSHSGSSERDEIDPLLEEDESCEESHRTTSVFNLENATTERNPENDHSILQNQGVDAQSYSEPTPGGNISVSSYGTSGVQTAMIVNQDTGIQVQNCHHQLSYNDVDFNSQENKINGANEERRRKEHIQRQERSQQVLKKAEGFTITDLMNDWSMKEIVIAHLSLPANTRLDETPIKYYPDLALAVGITDTQKNMCKGPLDVLEFMQKSMTHPRNIATLIKKVTEIRRFDIADKLEEWVLAKAN